METSSLSIRELKRLGRFMGRGNPLRSTAKALYSRNYSSLTSAKLYIGVLEGSQDGNLRDQILAAEALKFAPPDAISPARVEQALIDNIEPGRYALLRQGRGYLSNILTRIGWLCFIALVLGIVDWVLRNPHSSYRADTYTSMFDVMGGIDKINSLVYFERYGSLLDLSMLTVTIPIVVFVTLPIWSIAIDRKAEVRLRQVSAETLGRWGGIPSISVLLNAANNLNLRHSAFPSLGRALTRVQATDYGKLDSASMRMLSGILRSRTIINSYRETIPVVLDALELIGTGACVQDVQWVVENGEREEWRTQASRILPVLQERQRLQSDSSRLLRPAAVDYQTKSLLRPANGSGQEAEQSLLRVAGDDAQ